MRGSSCEHFCLSNLVHGSPKKLWLKMKWMKPVLSSTPSYFWMAWILAWAVLISATVQSNNGFRTPARGGYYCTSSSQIRLVGRLWLDHFEKHVNKQKRKTGAFPGDTKKIWRPLRSGHLWHLYPNRQYADFRGFGNRNGFSQHHGIDRCLELDVQGVLHLWRMILT